MAVKSILGKVKNRIEKISVNQFYDWKNIEATFIVSTGRTGTKFFGEFFTKNFKNAYSVHEPGPDFLEQSVLYRQGKLDANSFAKQLKFHRSLICKKLYQENIPIYIESNNNITSSIGLIEKVFPKHKIIFVVRDPKSYMVSSFNKIHGAGPGGYRLFSDNDFRLRLTADMLPNDPYFGKWKDMTRFEKLCWHWVTYNEMILEHLKTNKGLTLKFEDIFSDDVSSIQKIIEFIGLDASGVDLEKELGIRANISKNKEIKGYESWTEEQRNIFHKMTDATAQKLGYK